MNERLFKKLKNILVILLAILFVATITTASASESVSKKSNSFVEDTKDCSKYNKGYHAGCKQGYHDGFTDGKSCKEAKLFILIYYEPCSSGYTGGHFNGYRDGYNKGYALGKKLCSQSISIKSVPKEAALKPS